MENEKKFSIRIKIDSLDSQVTDYGREHSLNVYPSTTVHELRAMFEYAYDFPPKNQYFFVNGHLAYEDSTMDELNEIFNFPLKGPNRYQFGTRNDEPDEIRGSNGTYRLWLNEESRKPFHETFHAILEVLFPDQAESICLDEQNTSSSSSEFYERSEPTPPNPVNGNPEDILNDVHNLNKSIKQGNSDEAVRIVQKLVANGIHVQVKPSKSLENEKEFSILVQIDGNEYGIDQNGATIPVNVFSSTTIRELRAAFETAYQYVPTSQYFFVNGKLVSDNMSMKDLQVGPKSLFVLFLITYPRQFRTDGPWQCSSCSASNPPDNLRCRICSASRVE